MNPGDRFVPYKLFVGSFIPNCLMRFTGISADAKMVWARLAQFAGKDGDCHPKIETLMEECGLSRNKVLFGLKELENERFLQVVRPKGKDRLLHLSNKYYFLFHPCFEPTPPKETLETGTPGGPGIGTSGDTPVGTSGETPVGTSQENHFKENPFKQQNMGVLVSTPEFHQIDKEARVKEFKKLWARYPLKLGVKEAERHFLASVKKWSDLAQIELALERYLAYLKKETWQKAQHGKTWFNNWGDWVEFKAPQGEPARQSTDAAGRVLNPI